ncbi:hypothetical protein M407DRAFT_153413 [Tulasnella calospora MUT 4182]|uniref:F-box domain-containing protein n=1 Tax=Tulasnella calospora MUT 4182 TaxID=1051891 RepID=A0A0C3KC03_9AGAM|nr:hypothetical protein M407DRAFT_153413 [Tulasnella calospora MUT 4182]
MSTEKTQEIVARTLASFLAELDDVIGTSVDDQSQLEARAAAVENLQKVVGRQLSEYSVKLNRRRNSLLPIYRLPVELLIDIFLRVIDLIDWDMEQNRNIASVCKAWYDIIIQSPQFWHRINVSHDIDTIKRIMRRNADGPFSIQFDKDSIGEAKHEEVLTLLAPQSHRWQSIMFQGRLTDTIFKLISSPAPELTELFVYQWSGESQRKFELPEGKLIRRMDVGLVSLPWSSPRLSTLRSIQIRNLNKDLPTLSELSTILSSSPQLTWLRLSEWTETASPQDDTAPQYPIRLPNLETLVLQSIQPRYVNHLLSHVHSTSCTCLQIDDAPSKHLQTFDAPLVHLMTSSISTANSLNLDLDETKLKLAINSTPEAHVLDKWIYWANRKPGIEVTIQLKNLTEMRVLTEIVAGMDLAKGKGDDVERSISLTIAGRGSDPPPETTGETPMDPEAQTPFPCEALGYLPLIKEIRCSNHFNATPMLRYLGRPQTNFDDTVKWPCPKLSKLEVNPWESSADTMFEELKAFGEARVGASRAGDPPPATSEVTAAESDQNPESGTVENGGISTTSPAGADATATVASNDSSSGSGSSSDDTISGEPAAAASAVASAVPKQADTEASAAQPDDTSGADDTSSKVAAASVAETVIDEVQQLEDAIKKAREEEERRNRPAKMERLGVPSEVVERLKEVDLLKDIVSEL